MKDQRVELIDEAVYRVFTALSQQRVVAWNALRQEHASAVVFAAFGQKRKAFKRDKAMRLVNPHDYRALLKMLRQRFAALDGKLGHVSEDHLHQPPFGFVGLDWKVHEDDAVLMRLFRSFDTITKIFADGGYTGKLIGWAKEMFGYDVEVVKRNQMHTFQVLPKRWIVERTFAWLNWSRRLSKDYELRHTSAETMIHVAFAHLLLRRSM